MEKKNRIYAYNTHFEIIDYQKGENLQLERDLTYHDFATFQDFPRYLYDSEQRIFYVPRGYDIKLLEDWNGKPVTVVPNETPVVPIDFKLKVPPRDDNESKAIRFLAGMEEFRQTKSDSQKVLIMPPGFGKTYCTIAAIGELGLRPLIIVHTKNLKDQWVAKFKEYTSMGGPNIIDLDSSKALHDYLKKKPTKNQKIFIVTRSLLVSYCNRYGIHSLGKVLSVMGIGIKVFDEAHKEYLRTLLIDYATNVKYTFYLTATFVLSNYLDNHVFQRSFHMVNKLQFRLEDTKRHIIYISVLFNTHPNPIIQTKLTGKKGRFDRFRYIEYELECGIMEQELRDTINFFLNQKRSPGKTLILSSKKSTCEYFKQMMDEVAPMHHRNCAYYTGNKIDNYKSYDGICATPQMLGTGEDIPELRFMYNTEPGSSLPNTDQFSGRLRPYENGSKPTFYIEFIDVGFPKLYEWYLRRKKLLKTKVLEIKELNHTMNNL